MEIPRLPFGDWVADAIDWLTIHADWFFDFIRDIMVGLVEGFSDFLISIPAIVLVLVFALLGWIVRSPQFGIGTLVTFLVIMSVGQWENAMLTFALVTIATLIAIIIAVPLGIWAAQSDRVSSVFRPVLDFMQTMPAFVYLIPSVMFFSIGVVPGIFATVIFALPPGVRFTELGIRQVAEDTVEAGHAFGADRKQILFGIQLPLAVPTIMAGINQVIMLSLSMAVIAGIVGAEGLGKVIVSSISSLNVALGVNAGLSVVFIAIFLDRFTGAIGDKKLRTKSLFTQVQKARRAKQVTAA